MKLGPVQRKWVETLKEKPHRQTNNVLGERKANGHVNACCLGQALLCLYEHKNMQLPVGKLFSGDEEGSLREHYQDLGLIDEEGSIIGFDENYDSLAEMNDDGCTWSEIAEFIENNPEKVFNESL